MNYKKRKTENTHSEIPDKVEEQADLNNIPLMVHAYIRKLGGQKR